MNKRYTKVSMILLSICFIITTIFGVISFSFASVSPISTTYGVRFKQVVGGDDFSLALTYEGDVYGWGSNAYGQLGLDPTRVTSVTSPRKIDFTLAANPKETIIMLATSDNACAALTDKQHVYTWGGDPTSIADYNVLGRAIGASAPKHVPSPILNDSSPFDFKACDSISGGGTHFVVSSFGTPDKIYSWGKRTSGQARSDNNLVETSYFPRFDNEIIKKSDVGEVALATNAAPVLAVAGGDTVGYVDSAGKLYMYGKNYALVQNMDTSFANSAYTFPSVLGYSGATSATPFKQTINSATNSVLSNAVVRATNATAMPGVTISEKESVGFFDALDTSRASSPFVGDKVSIGDGFGYAVTANGLYGWGINSSNQLGSTSLTPIVAPTAITDVGATIKQVSAGRNVVKSIESGTIDFGTIAGNKLTIPNTTYDDTSKSFATAVLSDTGLWVWGKNGTTTIDKTNVLAKFKGVTDTNPIVRISSGYNGKIYAITKYGKLYEYDAFTGANALPFDEFLYTANETDTAGTSITNWVDGKMQIIEFANTQTSTASVTLGGISSATAKIKHYDNPAILETKAPLITNDFKDAYRILIPKATGTKYNETAYYDDNMTFVLSGTATPTLDFYFGSIDDAGKLVKGEEITSRIDHYIDYKFIKPAFADPTPTDPTPAATANDIELQITPKISTNGKLIFCELTVGRYDAYANDTQDKIMYDDKKVVFAFMSPDTAVAKTVTKDLQLPWLDVNDSANNKYSVALRDVSSGFDTFLTSVAGTTGIFETATSTEKLTNGIRDLSLKSDIGFPSSTKGSAYNNNLASYNDKYKYLLSDKDMDNIYFAPDNFDTTVTPNLGRKMKDNENSNNYDIYLNTINLDFFVTGSETDIEQKVKDYYNKYSFTIQIGAETSGKTKVTLSYDVIRIDAKLTTHTLKNNNVAGTKAKANIYPYVVDTDWQPNNDPRPVFTESVGVDIQSTLRLKEKYKNGNKFITGNPGSSPNATNEITMPPITTTIGTKTTISLSDLVGINDTTGDITDISFSARTTDENNIVNYVDFAKFEATFDPDLLTGTMESNEIVIVPKVPNNGNENYKFDVEIRRFVAGGVIPIDPTHVGTDQTNVKTAEIITIHYLMSVSDYQDANAFKPKDINSIASEIKNVSEGVERNASDFFTGYNNCADVFFSSVASANETILKVEISKTDKKKIVLMPINSGTTSIVMNAKQNDVSQTLSLPITVRALTIMPNTLSLINREGIHFSALRSTMISSNNLSIEDGEKLIYQSMEVQEKIDDGEWVTTEAPQLIKIPVYQKEAQRVDVEPAIVSSNRTNIATRILFTFSLTKDGTEVIYKVTQNLEVAKKNLVDNEGSPLVVTYNVKTNYEKVEENNEIYSVVGGFSLPLGYILKYLDSGIDKTKCSITLVTCDKSDAFSFQQLSDSITFRPNLNGSQKITVIISEQGSTATKTHAVTFDVAITGIITVLEKTEYTTLFMIVLFSTLGFLVIVFIIRLGVYWKRAAVQKQIIKKNQMLIKLRDKVHNKSDTANRETIVKTKLKLEDPKYAKMFTEMRQTKEAETGISLENSIVANKAANKTKTTEKLAKNKKGKKLSELQADLEAKKDAFAKMQQMNVDPSMMNQFQGGNFDNNMTVNDYNDGLSPEAVEQQIRAKINEKEFVFDDDSHPNNIEL